MIIKFLKRTFMVRKKPVFVKVDKRELDELICRSKFEMECG